MGGGGGASRNDNITNQKSFTFTNSGNLDLSGLFAFNYKGGEMNFSQGETKVTNTSEFYNSNDQRSQGGKGGDSSVGVGLGYGGMGSDTFGSGLSSGNGLSNLSSLSGGSSGSGGLSGGSGGGGSGSASASNSGYSPTEMNGSGSTFTITKGVDLNNKWLIGGGIAIGLAYILANRK